MGEQIYKFNWRNNSKRAALFGRLCRIVHGGGMNSILIEFMDTGQREVVSRRALRKVRA